MRTLTITASLKYPAAVLDLPVVCGEQKLTLNWWQKNENEGEYELLVQSSGDNPVATNHAQIEITPLVTFTLGNPATTVSTGETSGMGNEGRDPDSFDLAVKSIFDNDFDATRFTVSAPVFSEFLNTLKMKYINQVAADRYVEEIGGYQYGSYLVSTDRESKALLTANVVKAQENPTYIFTWKFMNGFYNVTGTQITDISDAVRQHTQDCFDKEGQCDALIMALTPTDLAEYKAALTSLEKDYLYSKMVLANTVKTASNS